MSNEQLVLEYQNGSKEALNKLVENNQRIVYKIAKRFYIQGITSIDIDDLIQEGLIGITIAAERYNIHHELKPKFITYAVYWINQRIGRYIAKMDTNQEISLNTLIGEGDDIELIDMLQDGTNAFMSAEEKIYQEELREELKQAMIDNNTLLEREVVNMRYGLEDRDPLTLEDIGSILDVNKSSVRRLETRALGKLRRSVWGRKKYKEEYAYYLNSYQRLCLDI